jgi:signal transduction histidine kinase
MFRFRPRSFRRILLVRILLLSVTVLVIGQYATQRKARTSLLETARQNLTSSAVRKAESIGRNVQTLQASLRTVSYASDLQIGSLAEATDFLQGYIDRASLQITCAQLLPAADAGAEADLALANQLPFNTCNAPFLAADSDLPWLNSPDSQVEDFYLVSAGPPDQPVLLPRNPWAEQEAVYTQLEIAVATPVYDNNGDLRYTLVVRAVIPQLENTGARSLVGDTALIDAEGTLVLHPDEAKVGQSIADVGDQDRLESIVSQVANGTSSTLHLFDVMPPEAGQTPEWLVGYSGVAINQSSSDRQTWTVLAITPLDHALQGLADIQEILIWLMVGLVVTNGLLALYIARSLSLPIERLIQYAQRVQDLTHFQEAPKDFKIWELNYLARVLNRMMKRLEDRAQELRHAWQDAQLANQLKSEFLANTSHELRTPLNAIIGCLRLVKDGSCDDRQEEMEFLARADDAAIHLLRIINDILDIAKIESGTLALKLEPVDIAEVIREVLDLQHVQIKQKGLDLVIPDLSEPQWVQADRAKLKQVLLNIVYNAIKFTEDGSIQIGLESVDLPPRASDSLGLDDDDDTSLADNVTASASPRAGLLLTVRDTGIGIAPEDQPKPFRPFVMVDGTTTRRFEGTGLGLAISRNLMELMGGDIDLDSPGRGQGTLASIRLLRCEPILTGDARATDPACPAEPSPEPSPSTPPIYYSAPGSPSS